MTIYYILLFCSALIFSLQFLITKQYQRYNGTGFLSSVRLSFFAYITIALFFFIKGCITTQSFNFGFSWFTLFMTLLIAVVSLSNVYMGIKVLSVGDMSIYSMFMMLGSLILPSFVGLIFYQEELTLIKGIALACMFIAILLSVSGADKTKVSVKALLYYIGVFVMNGLIGVLFTVHQNQAGLTAAAILNADGSFSVNNDVFMTWYGLSTVLLCGGVYLASVIIQKVKTAKSIALENSVKTEQIQASDEIVGERVETSKNGQNKAKNKAILTLFITIGLSALYGLCNGLGDYFIALATQPHALGSSVTFPIINGGTIVFSTIIGAVMYKEKIKPITIVSLVMVIVSTILFML